MAGAHRLAIVVNMGDSVGAVVDFTLKQHDAAVGGNSKVLAIENPYFKKVGAATSFTKVELQAAASNFVLSADFAAQEGMVVFEVLAENLDVENDYSHVSIEALDSTAAKLISVLHIVDQPKLVPAYSTAL
jgi:hypothetical protein